MRRSITDPSPVIPLLVVEDDDDTLDALRAFLTGVFGDRCRIDRALSGEQALVMMRSTEYHLLVSEQRLPSMSGVDLCHEARALQPDAVRILLTDAIDESTIGAAINSGEVFRLVSKPWSWTEFKQCLLNALEWRHSGRAMRLLLGEQQEAQRALVDSLAALERTQQQMVHVERLATVGRLASGIVHEVRNQLTGLKGVFSTLRLADGDVADTATRGHRLVKELMEQIRSIESFARAGGWAYDWEQTTVEQLLEQVCALHGLECHDQRLHVEADPLAQEFVLRVDLAKLAHALLAVIREGHDTFQVPITLRTEADGDVVRFVCVPGRTFEPIERPRWTELHDASLAVAALISEAHDGVLTMIVNPLADDYATLTLPTVPREATR